MPIHYTCFTKLWSSPKIVTFKTYILSLLTLISLSYIVRMIHVYNINNMHALWYRILVKVTTVMKELKQFKGNQFFSGLSLQLL